MTYTSHDDFVVMHQNALSAGLLSTVVTLVSVTLITVYGLFNQNTSNKPKQLETSPQNGSHSCVVKVCIVMVFNNVIKELGAK